MISGAALAAFAAVAGAAAEAGAQVGGTLYSDALAASGPASTFTGLFEYNLNTLYNALSRP